MTIDVNLPDGTIARFPDGTDPQVMRQALAKRFPPKATQSARPAITPEQRAANVAANAGRQSEINQTTISGMATPDRSVGQAVYDNLIGDPNDGVDSVGERLGRGANDVVKAGAAGLVRGAAGLVGLPGTLGDLMDRGLTAGGKAIGVIPESWQAPPQSQLSGAAITGALGKATNGATEYRGKSRAGKFAGTVGEFLPGAAAFGGVSPANLARFGVAPGVASEAAGQATEGTPLEGPARIAGALAGGMLPGLAVKGAAKVISPNGGADPERLKLAKILDEAGVPITAGQRVGSEALRRKEGLTAGGQRMSDAQREAFTGAALKTAGTDATRATPDVLAETASRIGAVFDDVTRGVDVTPDAASVTALAKAVQTYKSMAPTGAQAPLVSQVLKAASTAWRGGNAIPATTANTWRSSLSKLTTSPDAATREAASAALEAVDDMLTGALNATGRTADVARLAEARGQWRNFLAIQKAASGAGEGAAAGLVSPSALRNAVVQQGRSAFARGKRGDIGDLARAGEGVMKQLPSSGTAENLRAMLPAGAGSAVGAALGAGAGPLGAAAGAIAGAAIPSVAGALRMSGPMQRYLGNQAVGNALAKPGIGAGTSLLPFADGGVNRLR